MTALNTLLNMPQMNWATAPAVDTKRMFAPNKAHGPAGTAPVDPDIGLVARAQTGDWEALGDLLARHSRYVYRRLMAILRNAEEAQDAMQDTFLKTCMHIDGFQKHSKFSTWLMSIASNVALQRLRDQKRLKSFGETENESEFRFHSVQERGPNPEQLYAQAENRRRIERALWQVPSKYRTVLVLRDIEELSTEEAAAVLGLGIPALKARLFRARRMLREALSPRFAVDTGEMDKDQKTLTPPSLTVVLVR